MDSYFFLLLHPCTAVFGKSISFFKTQILVISLWYCKPTPAMARISSFLSINFSSFSNFFSVLVTPYNLKQIAAFGFPSAVLAGGGAAGTVFFLSSWVTFGGSFLPSGTFFLSSTFFLAALAFFVASSAFFLMSFFFSAFFPSDVIFFASAIFFLASLTESPISLLPSASSTSLLLFLPKPFAWA